MEIKNQTKKETKIRVIFTLAEVAKILTESAKAKMKQTDNIHYPNSNNYHTWVDIDCYNNGELKGMIVHFNETTFED